MSISQKNYHATIGCTINTRATEKRREEKIILVSHKLGF
jgi:predicted ATPase